MFEKENEITKAVIGRAIEVHKRLGPGLLESAYHECLCYELFKHEIAFQKEFPLPLVYDEVKLDCGYRADIIVQGLVIVEVKSVEALSDLHMAQVMTYMKLSHCRIGLLMNFNTLKLVDGIKRIAL